MTPRPRLRTRTAQVPLGRRRRGKKAAAPQAPPSPGRTTQHWLWVAGPEYYLDDDRDHRDLEPDTGFVPDLWWTCAPQTRQGDLVMLYRSRVRKNIAHLVIARSDAEVLDLPSSPFHGKHICQYEVIEKLDQPLAFATISADPLLQTWGAVKVRFVKSSFAVPSEMWTRMLDLAGVDPAALHRRAVDGITWIRLEKEIQKRLAAHPELLDAAGLHGLTLVKEEYYFVNRIHADLVYRRGVGPLRQFVVVELKRGDVGPKAVDQVLGYRKLLDARRRTRRATLAVLIGERLHPMAEPLVRRTANLEFIQLSDLNIAWDRTRL